MLRAIDAFDGQPGTRVACDCSHYFFPAGRTAIRSVARVRPRACALVDPRSADEDAAGPIVCRYLARLVELLGALQPIFRRRLPVLGVRSSSRPISDGTLNAALRKLGYAKDEATGHGFRATASTLLKI